MYHWSKGGTGGVQRSDWVPRVARSPAVAASKQCQMCTHPLSHPLASTIHRCCCVKTMSHIVQTILRPQPAMWNQRPSNGHTFEAWRIFFDGNWQQCVSEYLILGGKGYCGKNIARISNAVQCQSQSSGNKDCHESRFSIVRNVISDSNVTSH